MRFDSIIEYKLLKRTAIIIEIGNAYHFHRYHPAKAIAIVIRQSMYTVVLVLCLLYPIASAALC
jgi:hypothetical protein